LFTIARGKKLKLENMLCTMSRRTVTFPARCLGALLARHSPNHLMVA